MHILLYNILILVEVIMYFKRKAYDKLLECFDDIGNLNIFLLKQSEKEITRKQQNYYTS